MSSGARKNVNAALRQLNNQIKAMDATHAQEMASKNEEIASLKHQLKMSKRERAKKTASSSGSSSIKRGKRKWNDNCNDNHNGHNGAMQSPPSKRRRLSQKSKTKMKSNTQSNNSNCNHSIRVSKFFYRPILDISRYDFSSRRKLITFLTTFTDSDISKLCLSTDQVTKIVGKRKEETIMHHFMATLGQYPLAKHLEAIVIVQWGTGGLSAYDKWERRSLLLSYQENDNTNCNNANQSKAKCDFPKLKEILMDLPLFNYDSNCLIYISNNCPKIEIIDGSQYSATNPSNVSDQSLISLGRNCKMLKFLPLTQRQNLPRAVLAALPLRNFECFFAIDCDIPAHVDFISMFDPLKLRFMVVPSSFDTQDLETHFVNAQIEYN